MKSQGKPHTSTACTALLLAAVLALAGCPGGDVSTVTLGVALNRAIDEVRTAVDYAANSFKGAAFDAGSTILFTLDDFRSAYEPELDTSVDRLDRTTSKKLQEMQTIVDTYTDRFDATVKGLASSAQQLVNTLPLAGKVPQVRAFTPRFVAPTTSARIEVSVLGNFPQAAVPDYLPTLAAGTTTLQPAGNTTGSLTFSVPRERLSPGSATAISPTSLQLSVPYKTTNPVSRRRTATFQLLLGSLPASPGSLTLVRTVQIPTTEITHVVGPSYTLDSGNDKRDHVDNLYYARPDPGRRVIPDTSAFVVTWHRGQENRSWCWRWDRRTPEGVSAYVTTWWKALYAHGGVQFHFEFDQALTRYVPQDVSTPLALGWGDQRAVTVVAGHWKLLYHSFDGRYLEISGPVNTQFLVVGVVGDTVTVKTSGTDTAADLW